MARYIEVEDYKDWARNELPTVDDAAIEAALAAAEQSLDNGVGRRIALASGPASARAFPVTRSSVLPIHDCTTVTAVTDTALLVVGADYQLEPLNGLSWSGEAVPCNSLRRTTGGYWYGTSPAYTVSVTATWGWPAIPAMAVEACKVLTKAILDGRTEIKFGIAGFTDGGAVSEREAKIVRDFISDYSSAQMYLVA